MIDAFQTSGTSPTSKNEPDFVVVNDGSVLLLRPLTESAHTWVDDNIGPDNGFQPYYPTVVIEPRYVGPVIEGIREYGLSLEVL